MRIGILSDIHSNLEALNETLASLERFRPDTVICLGDVVGYGASVNECCALIRKVSSVTLLGNHDAAVSGRMDYSFYYDAARHALDWTAARIDLDHLDWLRTLPYAHRIDDHASFTHGSPLDPPASGSLVSGRLNAAPMGNGVHFTGEIGGLGKGSTHAIHIHEKGDCSAADASSAGGHFNPAAKPHGKVESSNHHAGDMNNIVADRDGVAQVSVHAAGVSLGGRSRNDIAGRAVVVHAAPDDYTSQPAGNAGARVACGIITVQR